MAMELCIFSLIFDFYILFAFPVHAQTYISSTVWVVPDGNTADLSRTYTEGITLQVTWNPIPEGYQFRTLSNLWVTTWDYEKTEFSQLLTKNVNTNNGGTYDWTITIPANVLSKEAKYVLRFKDLSPLYNSSSQEVSSTGFLIINGGSSSSSTTTSSTQTFSSGSSTSLTSNVTTSPVTSTPVVATISATSTSQSASTLSSGDSGLSGGAKAGIAVGAVVAAPFIAGLAYILFRRNRHARVPSHETPTYPPTDPPTYYEQPKQYSTGYTSNVVEIGGRERVELQGS